MAVQSELINTNAGPFAIRDFGGRGPDLLFVHGTGHNLEVWSPLAQALRGCFRMVAFDMRGHGQTPAQSTGPEQYWRDIEVLMAALGLRQPLLVGHSTGGYAVSAHAASGGMCRRHRRAGRLHA
jgi:pimeloyl-ACP methyl ester carboxylesterase